MSRLMADNKECSQMITRVLAVSLMFLQIAAFKPVFADSQSTKGGIEKTYHLYPNSPREFENPFIWTAKARCYIHIEDAMDDMEITGLKNTFSINSREIHSGETTVFHGVNNERFDFVAKKQAKMRITNKGVHTITAKCELRT